VLEGRERFRRVEAAGNLLVLVPSEQLQSGERLRLQVRFAKGAGPDSAVFVLVVHRGQAEHLVEVSFAPPPPDTCHAELQSTQAQLQRCLEARAPLPSTKVGIDALTRLIAAGAVDQRGLAVSELREEDLPSAAAGALHVTRLALYRSVRRLAIELEVENPEPDKPWVPEGAELVAPPGRALEALSVLQRAAREQGASQLVWVELAMPPGWAHKNFELKLWDAGRARTLTLPGVKLP
jgi:uncharacterized protein (TIGR02268 family)